ncbi:YD repeat protein [Shewanella piezotolerans WP3]|uniref:YD repeat protein n=1 Tax=Shewanella piezotolerans (strain WP3 / JCM 13877) TaxID=225849 RepID=B8CT60_SHEPW|nr:RHS repeat protein [Shewanella piezotolerans]ACJ30836.1 YD repeat protein [Shewanella piezotolerans WP3]
MDNLVKKVGSGLLLAIISTSFVWAANGSPSEPGENEFLSGASEFDLERLNPNPELEVLSNNLAGENISLVDGSISFSITDIHIPLSSNLAVSVQRNYSRLQGKSQRQASAFGDWELNTPTIESTYIIGDTRLTPNGYAETACSRALTAGPIRAALGQTVEQYEYFNGVDINIPGKSSGKLMDSTGPADYTTKDNFAVFCKKDTAGNEYYSVNSPDGVTYTFSQRITEKAKPLMKAFKAAARKKLIYAVSQIEDSSGNRIKYSYVDSRIASISYIAVGVPSEELVRFNYDSLNRISTIVAAGKSWAYSYSGQNLSSVTRPDGNNWLYNFPEYHEYAPQVLPLNFGRDSLVTTAQAQCQFEAKKLDRKEFYVTHPNGAFIQFNVGLLVHGKTDVPSAQMISASGITNKPLFNINACYGNIGVISKKITLSPNTSYQWNYQFSNDGAHWDSSGFNPSMWVGIANPRFNSNALLDGEKQTKCAQISDCNVIPNDLGFEQYDLRLLTVTEPDLSKKRYYISKRWDHTDGEIVSTQISDASSTLRLKEVKAFVKSAKLGTTEINSEFVTTNEKNLVYRANNSKKSVEQDGVIYTNEYTNYNSYGTLLTSVSYNSVSPTLKRYSKTDFQHDINKWQLNLPTKYYLNTSSSFGSPYRETIYNSKLQPYQQKTMGRLVTTHSYHIDGNLKKTTYNGSNRYEQFEDYYRGKARKITLPCAISNGCNTANGSTANTMIAKVEVNSDGTTKSVTDFKGFKTSYSYNAIGWLTKVDYADSNWTDKIISYAKVTSANDGISGSGIAVGQLKQTITQGNFEQKIYHDGLLRPTFTRTRDKADGSTINYQRNNYDYDNRPTLQTYPSSSASNTIGMTTEYDALGRVITSTRQSDNAFTTVEYLSGNRKQVTDAKGNVTTTTYQAFGSPSYSKPTLIEAPDSSDTRISYNKFDQVTSISQGGVTEKRLYDAYQQLCKTYRPETGVTAYGYNAQRQPIWRAEGTNGGSSSCAAASVPASHKVLLAYDNFGQLKTENFPDTTPDNHYRYDANGNLTKLTSGSGSSAIVWDYQYNSLNLVEKESLAIDGKSFVLDWGYNALGAISSLKYPSGETVSYAPNALGQATKAAITAYQYASDLSYHPNGQLKRLRYGNGIERNIALDSTGRIDEINDKKGSSYQLRLDPRYDKNDNVTGVIDWVSRVNDIDNMHYDGVDRLESADGKWGTGSYSYDGLGNILSRSINGSSINYHYNSLNRLNNITGAYRYSYGYDTRGNVKHNGRYGLTFNRANQVTAAKDNSYRYDGHNRRVKQTTPKGVSYSVYSQGGQLLYRRKPNGNHIDSVYVGKQLVADVERR